MRSLTDLNNFGASAIEVTDLRPAGVIFDRNTPLLPEDQIITVTSTEVTGTAGIEIEEIINYDVADVRYRVTVYPGITDSLPDSTVSWASLPTGVTLSTSGDEYTLSGLTSVSDWDAVKEFTWTLPSDYASYPIWYIEAAVIYYDEATDTEITKSWLVYDRDYYYLSTMPVEFSSYVNVRRIAGASADLTSEFTMREWYTDLSARFTMVCNGQSIPVEVGAALLASSGTMSVTAKRYKGITANLSTTSTMSTTVLRKLNFLSSMTAVSSLPIAQPEYDPLTFVINVTDTRKVLNFGIAFTEGTGSDKSYTVDWGNGTSTYYTGSTVGDPAKTYTTNGYYTVTVTPTQSDSYLKQYQHNYDNTSTCPYIYEVNSWGNPYPEHLVNYDSGYDFSNFAGGLRNAFINQPYLTVVPEYIPPINFTNSMFYNCTSFNSPMIKYWKTQHFIEANSMFYGCTSFNQPLKKDGNQWNTGRIQNNVNYNMQQMFSGCSAFDQNISSWDVHLIPSKPSGFDTSTPVSWTTAEKPVWGTTGS